MTLPFYRAFEDRHRGPRDLIKSRLKVYLPFIAPLKNLYAKCATLDLGCGRGEWLELMLEHDFDPKGVDLDEGMLATCHELKLPVEQGDAIAYLQKLPDESMTVVSGFHIAEHIPFDSLQLMVNEALRVLKPAGLLILETPNAENITVGTHSFYMDPTHEKPIPHPLLSFLTEHTGFIRNKLLRLQEAPELRQAQDLSLLDVLQGPSPDYAIVAQKRAPARQLVLFDAMFNKEYGLALDSMAVRYEFNLQNNLTDLNEKINQTSQQQQQQEQQQHHYQHLLDQLQLQVNEVSARAQHWASLADARAELLESVMTSKSWRITQPLRSTTEVLKRTSSQFKTTAKQPIKSSLQKSMRYVLSRPVLRVRLNQWLQRYPKLYSRLIQFARHRGLIPGGSHSYAQETELALNHLSFTPRAQQIYTELKQAIEDKNKGVK